MLFFWPILLASALCPDFPDEVALSTHAKAQKPFAEACAVQALNKHWFGTALEIVNAAVHSGEQPSAELKDLARRKKKEVEKMIAKISTNTKSHVINPAFQWAQSPKEVFFDIKFSHRLDAPGCSSLRDEKVEISENWFRFTGKCVKSSQKYELLLEFEFFEKVLPEESSYSFTAGGRLKVDVKKAVKAAWDLPMKGKKPHNMQIWWEIKEMYKREINELTGDKDADDIKHDSETQFDDLLNNPNVVIENSYVNGKYVDNRKERGL
jgi:hypothetical protein